MRKLLLIVILWPSFLLAEFSGTQGLEILAVPLGARASGMGGAFTAVADDVSAVFWNPSGLVQIQGRQFQAAYQKGLEDTALQTMSIAYPAGRSVVAGSLLFGQNGTIEVNRTDDGTDTGNPIGTDNDSAGSDMVASTSWAQGVPFGGTSLHAAGVSFKFIRSTLAGNFSASSYAWDLGYLIRIPSQNLSLGAVLQNWGKDLVYKDQGTNLPQVVRTGLAWRIPDRSGQNRTQTVAADFSWPKEDDFHWNLGGEFATQGPYLLRAGYEFKRDLPGFSLGLGFRKSSLSIDYAFGLITELNDLHRASILWNF